MIWRDSVQHWFSPLFCPHTAWSHYEAGCLPGCSPAAPMKFTFMGLGYLPGCSPAAPTKFTGTLFLFSHGRVRSPHTFQNDFTFSNCLSTGLQLDSAIGLVLYLLLTVLISRQVWTSTSIQLLIPLLMPLIQSHKREWRRQEKPQWCMDTWRCHFFPISNWQGSVILQGRFLPAPLHNNYSGS